MWFRHNRKNNLFFWGTTSTGGKDSCGVIEQLIQFKKEFPGTVFIRVNHDQLLLDSLAELKIRHDLRTRDISQEYADYPLLSDLEMFLSNGGNETLRSYHLRDMSEFPKEHIAFLETTELVWRYDQVFTKKSPSLITYCQAKKT